MMETHPFTNNNNNNNNKNKQLPSKEHAVLALTYCTPQIFL
jgi:hypothetical protein